MSRRGASLGEDVPVESWTEATAGRRRVSQASRDRAIIVAMGGRGLARQEALQGKGFGAAIDPIITVHGRFVRFTGQKGLAVGAVRPMGAASRGRVGGRRVAQRRCLRKARYCRSGCPLDCSAPASPRPAVAFFHDEARACTSGQRQEGAMARRRARPHRRPPCAPIASPVCKLGQAWKSGNYTLVGPPQSWTHASHVAAAAPPGPGECKASRLPRAHRCCPCPPSFSPGDLLSSPLLHTAISPQSVNAGVPFTTASSPSTDTHAPFRVSRPFSRQPSAPSGHHSWIFAWPLSPKTLRDSASQPPFLRSTFLRRRYSAIKPPKSRNPHHLAAHTASNATWSPRFLLQHPPSQGPPTKSGRRFCRYDTRLIKIIMNRFLTRRKDRAADDNASSGKKKRGKKGQAEPEPTVELKMVLPSTDDFRTSLIMPSLSTRFSMLREQDDPSSKLGKASDDSVLHPKRQSRLHEFGFVPGGLSDIAEVSSLHSSIRPPFANERQNSFDSNANTEDGNGSIMSRARPGEGNVLFGGRQKIYKISNTGSANSLGRALYEDDVNVTTFQKRRQQERERQLELDRMMDRANDDQVSEPSSPKEMYSPSLSGSIQRRATSSSTNSGTANTRLSTAATSIASQGANSVPAPSPALPNSAATTSPTELNRSATKRRLYDQGLDQHIHDQQSSALNRLNSIQRTRAPTGRSTPPLLFSQTRSATNLNERFNRAGSLRTDSPTMYSGKDAHSAASSPIVSRPQSPPLTSPLASDSDDAQTLHSALQHHDRGKATAMGAFNKPAQAFSEQQYTERLKRMQSERESPASRAERPRKPSLRERAEQEQRKRAEAIGSNERQRSDSIPEESEAPSAFSVFQRAANQIRAPAAAPANPPPKEAEPSPQNAQSPDSQRGATFFASPGSSDDEEDVKAIASKPSDLARRLENIPTIPAPAARNPPAIRDHPALRSRSNTRPEDSEHPALRSRSNSRPAPPMPEAARSPPPEMPKAEPTKTDDPDIDSPTLGPDNGGLSGLIRQHLRNVSNVSSDYGDANQIAMSPPAATTTTPLSLRTRDPSSQRRQPASESDTPAHSSYSHSNPWDLEDIDNPYYGEQDSVSSTSPVDAQRPKMPAPSSNATQPARSRAGTQEEASQWDELKKTHTRGASTETQHERDAFERELAERQRAIQESLRNKVGQDNSRGTSPAPPGGLKTALSMLRSKSSRESFATVDHAKQAESNKAMRMLGIGANSANGSNTSLAGQGDRFYGGDHWRSEDMLGQRGPSRARPGRVLEQSEQDARRELEQRLHRAVTDENTREPRSHGRSPPASSKSSSRNRSSSELSSGRSHSRPGRYRDDLEQAMAEGTGSRSVVYPPNTTPSVPGFVANATPAVPAERPSLDSQSTRMRSRSNSRTAAAGYFESKHLQPIHTGKGPVNGTSPHLSPAVHSPKPPYSAGLPASPRPSPGAPSPSLSAFRPQPSPVTPFSANNTPPVSGPNTPVAPNFQSNGSMPMQKLGTQRKKSIAKADISEPIFISGTSNVDTISLPAGASLKNGMDEPPPVPPLNPMRRRFGFGRKESSELDGAVRPPYAEPVRTNSSDALASQSNLPRHGLRKTSSEGKSLHGQAQSRSAGASPAMPPTPFGRNNSPPRPINDRPIVQRPMDGAMF
ncbi:hypothetical protein EJ04DRAFT_606789 [Polyplosphaeria fusca]|uniref:Uncharacterized protein n=1 Tax=Polyplosphaeria fusca TaxID=682080 RepID=A0A9P4QX04_9PLEO|nr:hypothetical protein EJ04DRAFT_606789 [Polyplosphaeria fusca]